MFSPEMIASTAEKRKVAGALLTLLGILLWLYVIATFRVWWVDPSNIFGLYQVVPFWFWLGILCLLGGIFVMLDCKSKHFFLFQLLALNVMVWVTPAFIEPNARVTDTWNHYSFTHTILDTGHLTFTGDYKYWPGSFVFNSLAILVSGMPFAAYLKFFPLISSTTFILGYYLIVRKLINDREMLRVALVLQVLLNLWLQFHFSPQAFALMLLPWVFLPFMAKTGWRWQLVSVFFIGAVMISHPTTGIFVGSILFCIYFMNTWLAKSGRSLDGKFIVKLLLMSLPLVITIAILSYFGNLRFDVLGIIGSIPGMAVSIFKERTSDTPSLIRLTIFALFFLMSLAFLWHFRSRIRDSWKLKFTLGWILGATLIFIADLGYPGAHFHNRALFFLYFALPLLALASVFRIDRLKSMKQPIIALLVIISLVNLATIFNIENEALISDSNLSSTEFILNHASNETFYAEQSATTIYGLVLNATVVRLTSRGEIPDRTILVFDDYALVSDIVGARTNYLYLRYHDERYNDLVYSSGVFEMYLHNYTQPGDA